MDRNKFHIPERFKGFTVLTKDLPEAPYYEALYDIPTRTILVNSAAEPEANVVWLRVSLTSDQADRINPDR